MHQEIPVHELRTGMYVVEYGDGSAERPHRIIRSLIKTSEEVTDILRNGVRTVVIDVERGLAPGGGVQKPAPRYESVTISADAAGVEVEPGAEASAAGAGPDYDWDATCSVADVRLLDAVRRGLTTAAAAYSDAADCMGDMVRRVRQGHTPDLASAEPVCEKIVNSAKDCAVCTAGVSAMRSDRSMAAHGAGTALLAAAFGVHLELDDGAVAALAQAGLVHDLGMALVPPHVLIKRGALDAGEQRLVHQHTLQGYRLLQAQANVRAETLAAAVSHHERYDASGYPRSKPWKGPLDATTIVAVCDVFMALTSDRPHRKALSGHEAMRLIFRNKDAWFASETVEAFVRFLGVYPMGSLVQLSGGGYGVVAATEADTPHKPLVVHAFDRSFRSQPPMPVRVGQGHDVVRCLAAGEVQVNAEALLA